MALVIVRAPLGDARQHRQDRLCTVERLDLALLVDAEHQRAVRRREIQAYVSRKCLMYGHFLEEGHREDL